MDAAINSVMKNVYGYDGEENIYAMLNFLRSKHDIDFEIVEKNNLFYVNVRNIKTNKIIFEDIYSSKFKKDSILELALYLYFEDIGHINPLIDEEQDVFLNKE